MAADVVTELLGNADGAVTLANVAPGLLQLRQRVRVQSLDTQQVDRRLYQAVLPLPDGEVFPVVLQPAVVFHGFRVRRLAFQQVSTVRFAFGLIASAAALPIVGDKAWAGTHDSFYIALLAVVTGYLALNLYYYGLQRTPAVLAALGELAFPVTAALVGIYVFNSNLRWTQWLGVAITVAVVTLLPVRRREIVRLPGLASAPAAG